MVSKSFLDQAAEFVDQGTGRDGDEVTSEREEPAGEGVASTPRKVRFWGCPGIGSPRRSAAAAAPEVEVNLTTAVMVSPAPSSQLWRERAWSLISKPSGIWYS